MRSLLFYTFTVREWICLRIKNKCFLLSGKIHLTLNRHLLKSPVWKSKKRNTGVQEQENKFHCTLHFNLLRFMSDIIPSVFYFCIRTKIVSEFHFSSVAGRTPATPSLVNLRNVIQRIPNLTGRTGMHYFKFHSNLEMEQQHCQ